MDSFLSLFDPGRSDETTSGDESSTTFDSLDRNGNKEHKSKKNNQKFCVPNVSPKLHYPSNDVMDFDQDVLPPEPQVGNIEYKLKLINPSNQRFEHLVTQMKWRLREGQGEAIYEIGVSDSGKFHGLNSEDMTDSLNTLTKMANKLGATISVLRRKSLKSGRSVVEVLVRKIPDDQHNIEVRVAVLGGVDAGKSTLLGVLTQGEYDNGRGRARLNMFRHFHEIQTGRTSSISHETLGFDPQGNVINYKYNEMMTAEEISDKSTKLVTFMDLAGHKRYLKTTVQALSGYLPHHAMIVVSATGSRLTANMTEEHMAIVRALDMPFFVVITKVDLISPEATIQELIDLLTSIGCRKIPFLINTEDDVLTAKAHHSMENIVPIFCVSNVTGAGLNLITKYLFVLSPNISNSEKERLEQEPVEFQIDEIFKVAEVGLVCGGLLTSGVVTERTRVKIGPLENGKFVNVTVETIHRNKAPCRVVRAGQSASLSFVGPDDQLPNIRSGMVILGDDDETSCGSFFFQASVSVLHHSTAIYQGFQTTVHIGSIRQTAIIEGIMGQKGLRTGGNASVLFRFVRHPEYIKAGARILFREGSTKGIGTVTQVFPLNLKTDEF